MSLAVFELKNLKSLEILKKFIIVMPLTMFVPQFQ